MFFKKRKKAKKRVICPISVINKLIHKTVETDAGMCEFIFIFEEKEHKVGLSSDYNRNQGFFDPIFYLDDQVFNTYEKFKAQAVLNGEPFINRTDEIEIIGADRGAVKFPWYTALEDYVISN